MRIGQSCLVCEVFTFGVAKFRIKIETVSTISQQCPSSSLGKAGIVMGLEVSPLARNNADWHRLLEICALTDTLILDEDGIYDPAHFNDRLLLGLKGTMSESELHILRARLIGGMLNKAKRGQLRVPLPIGFVYDTADRVVLDPDRQVPKPLVFFFKSLNEQARQRRQPNTFVRRKYPFPVASTLVRTKMNWPGENLSIHARYRCCTIHDMQGHFSMDAVARNSTVHITIKSLPETNGSL